MVRPRISNSLKGSLGELYYKVYCDQRGWAFTRLENLYSLKNRDWVFTFKKGFYRIKIQIPHKIRDEISWLVRPTNYSDSSPSFVFDFLACKVKHAKSYPKVMTSDFFTWVESKTGKAIFTTSQFNAMKRIKLPLAIFHIDDVLAAPDTIEMHWDMKSGEEWLDQIEPIENEIYEFREKYKLAKPL